ncbi:MAG: hypothetical protein JNJ45_07390 [Chthonomonas sp.]|nr:hypothetical protein [Chthonomonas sp.]
MLRLIALVSVVSVAALSSASFDLMLLGDNTTAGSQRVMRYDPVSRVALGSFGTGFLNADVTGIATDASTNRAFVLTANGRVTTFNYNTGDYMSTFTISTLYGNIAWDSTSGLLFTGNGGGSGTSPGRGYDSNGVAQVSNTGSLGTASLRNGASVYRLSWGVNSVATLVEVQQHALSGGAPTQAVPSAVAWTGANVPRAALYSVTNQFLGLTLNAGNLEMWSIPTNSAGTNGSVSLVENFGASTNNNIDMVAGHGPLVYVLNGNQIISYNSTVSLNLGTSTLPFGSATTIGGMAIVLAPEPGGFLAFGVAALFLARRKRS